MIKEMFLGLIKFMVRAEPINVWFDGFVLLLINFICIAIAGPSLFAHTLLIISLIVMWTGIALLWADILFLGEYCLLKNDKDKEEAKARLWENFNRRYTNAYNS